MESGFTVIALAVKQLKLFAISALDADFEQIPPCFVLSHTVKISTEPPEIQLDVKLLAGLTARAGTKIELPADVKGKPDPRVKWTKADLVLRADDRITIDTQPGHSKLSIAKTTRGDTATYIIEAVNVCGRATATIDVNILGKDAVKF